MKKLLYTAALMLMAAMVLTACNGNQEEQEEQEYKPIKKQVGVTYTINCSQDMIDATDLVVRIYKDSVDVVTDTIRDTLWTKTINDMVPYYTGLIWTVTPKATSKINKDTLDEVFAKYSVKFVEPDSTFNKGVILHYRNLPVSKLEAACELMDYQHSPSWTIPRYKILFSTVNNHPHADHRESMSSI
jgi:hypothetical protein